GPAPVVAYRQAVRGRARRQGGRVESRDVRRHSVAARLLAVVAVAAIICTASAASLTPRLAHAASTSTVQGFSIGEGESTTEYDRLVRKGTNTLYLMVFWEAD